MFKALDAKKCALANAASVGIVDKKSLQERENPRNDEVVDDAITKICSKDLPFYGFVHHKGDASTDFVSARNELFIQLDTVFFVFHLKFEGIYGVPLLFSARKVSPENIFESDHLKK